MKGHQAPLLGSTADSVFGGLNVVYARYQRTEPFSFSLFQGFDSLRVLTFSASIPMTVRMLNLFENVECVFGYEGVVRSFGDILAFQKELSERLLVAIKGLDDERKQFIVEKAAAGQARFLVVKDAVAHSKLYLLEAPGKRRVIVGSANLSERAFSGKQAETILVFDDDDLAWQHYEGEYTRVRHTSTSEFHLPDLSVAAVPLDDIPVVQETKESTNGVTLFVNSDAGAATVPTIIRKVERLSEQYGNVANPIAKPKSGRLLINNKVVGTILQLIKNQRPSDQQEEETNWLSINQETHKVLLSGKEVALATDPKAVASDVACIIEYFENFKKGFHGDVEKHQKNYFMFMSWFYFSPFVCDLRNNAISGDEFIFDFPMFAVLFGKSNTGKSELIRTLMMSMFGEWKFVDKQFFTTSNLRALQASRKRFPVVFDDVERVRFAAHGSSVIKDETFMLEEYPPFVLSMNAESQSFSTEIIKRCLMLYTSTALPENSDLSRELYKSVSSIRRRLSTALYHEYLRRALHRLADGPLPGDMLAFSSEILTQIFREHSGGSLPAWCNVVSINDYRGKKYERIQMDLLKMYETNRSIWDIHREEVVMKAPLTEVSSLRRDIPDWLLRPGSKAGNLVLDRYALEGFLGIRLRHKRFLVF